MVNIDDRTRRLLIQDAEINRERIETSRKPRIDAIMDICYKADIVWAVWSNGHAVVKGHDLVATGERRTSWIAVPCADKAEAADIERRLA